MGLEENQSSGIKLKRILAITDLSQAGEAAILYANTLAIKFNSNLIICPIVNLPEVGLYECQWSPIPYYDRIESCINKQLEIFTKNNKVNSDIILTPHFNVNEMFTLIRDENADIIIIPSHMKGCINRWIRKDKVHKSVGSIVCPLIAVPFLKADQLITNVGHLRLQKTLLLSNSVDNMLKTFLSKFQFFDNLSSEFHFFFISNQRTNDSEFKAHFHLRITKHINQLMSSTNFELIKPVKIIIEDSHHPDQILEYAREHTINMIFLDTNINATSKRFFNKNISMQIIFKSHCPVLVINSNST